MQMFSQIAGSGVHAKFMAAFSSLSDTILLRALAALSIPIIHIRDLARWWIYKYYDSPRNLVSVIKNVTMFLQFQGLNKKIHFPC